MSTHQTSTAPGAAPQDEAGDQNRRSPSTGELFASLSTQVTTLVRGEIELTKTKALAFGKRVGSGGALLAVAGVLGLYLLAWIFHTIEVALAHAVPDWAAALIVVGLLVLVIAVLALVGMRLLKAGSEHTPDPGTGLRKDVDAFKKGLGK